MRLNPIIKEGEIALCAMCLKDYFFSVNIPGIGVYPPYNHCLFWGGYRQ